MAKVRTAKKKHVTRRAGLGKMWKSAKKQIEEQPDIFGIEVPDGPYIGLLTGASTKESAGDWNYVDFVFTVQEGEHEDETISRRDGIETEENITWLIRDLARLGVDVDDLEIDDKDELDAVLTELVEAGPKVRLVAKTNDAGYQNVYINKLLDVGEPSGDASFEKGDRVEANIDGTDYSGEITSIGDDKAKITFDDGDKGTHDLSELTKLEAAEPPQTDDIENWIGEQAGYKDSKKMYAGKIIKVDASDNTFVMKTDTGKKITGDISDLQKPEDEGSGGWSKGDRVRADIDGTTYAGEIQKIKDDEAIVEFDDGDVLPIPLDKLEAEAAEDEAAGESADLEVGASVEVTYKGKEMVGTVKKINEEDEEITVFLTKLKKKIVVPASEIAIIVD